MSSGIGEDFKKILLAGLGAVATTAEKSKELVDHLAKKGEITWEQGKILNEELARKVKRAVQDNLGPLMEDGKTAVESVAERLRTMTKEQLKAVKEQLEAMEEAREEAPGDGRDGEEAQGAEEARGEEGSSSGEEG